MRKRAIDVESAPVGFGDFLVWMQDKSPNWEWMAVRSPLTDVRKFYRELGWELTESVTKLTDVSNPETCYCLCDPLGKGYEWVILMTPWQTSDREMLSAQAKTISQKLTTKSMWCSQQGSEITYELLDWGDRVEFGSLGKTFTFESTLRPPSPEDFLDGTLIDGFPKFHLFIDEVLADLHLYLFPCAAVKTEAGYGYIESADSQNLVRQVQVIIPVA